MNKQKQNVEYYSNELEAGGGALNLEKSYMYVLQVLEKQELEICKHKRAVLNNSNAPS